MARYTEFRNGFQISSDAAIDRRMYLTKSEMALAESLFMLPDKYFCICSEDGRLYMYDASATNNANGFGKFVLIDEKLSFDTDPAIANLDSAVQRTETIEEIKEVLDGLKMDGGEIS